MPNLSDIDVKTLTLRMYYIELSEGISPINAKRKVNKMFLISTTTVTQQERKLCKIAGRKINKLFRTVYLDVNTTCIQFLNQKRSIIMSVHTLTCITQINSLLSSM